MEFRPRWRQDRVAEWLPLLLSTYPVALVILAGAAAGGFGTLVLAGGTCAAVYGGPVLWLRWADRRREALLRRCGWRICPRCGYVLVGLAEDGVCPECGLRYRGRELARVWSCVRR